MRHGLDPWSGKIPPAVEQLSPCATTIPVLWSPWAATNELKCLEPVPCNKRWHGPEKAMHRKEEQLQLERSLCSEEDPAQKTQHNQIYIYIYRYIKK